jgi:hypothetical protein
VAPPYVIDTSIWIHVGRHHPPDIFRSVWQGFDTAIATSQALRGVAAPGMFRQLGITGTRGYHLAAYSITLTVLAAPIDDLWHRTFGLEVTLWSPPHLLGLVGGILNAAACLLIACEVYPARSRARSVALVVAGALVFGGISLGVQPATRIAYVYGGLLFFTYPLLASLFAPLALVVTAHLSKLRVAPVLVVVTVFVIGLAGAGVSRAGFAWVQPVSFLAEEIAKDPTSPIAVAHEMARKNGTTPGRLQPDLRGVGASSCIRDGDCGRARSACAGLGRVQSQRFRHGERHPGPHAGVRAVAAVCP